MEVLLEALDLVVSGLGRAGLSLGGIAWWCYSYEAGSLLVRLMIFLTAIAFTKLFSTFDS